MDRLWKALNSGVEPPTLFLIITNVILGLFVLGSILLVLRSLFREIVLRRRARSFSVTSLGLTLTDGGQRNKGKGHLAVTNNGKIQTQSDDPREESR